MDKPISVTEAVAQSKRKALYPSLLVFFTLGIPMFYYALADKKYWFIAIALIAAFVVSRIYYNRKYTGWCIWAFNSCEDIIELERAAVIGNKIEDKIVWIKTLTPINYKEKKELAAIAQRLEQLHAAIGFVDDLAIGPETNIYENPLLIKFIGWLFVIMGTLLLLLWIFGILLIVTGVGVLIYDNKVFKPMRKLPTITISDEGIATYSAGFNEWKDIKNERVEIKGTGKHSYPALSYDYIRGSEELDLSYLKTDRNSISHAIYIHRQRYNESRKEMKQV